MGLIGVFSIALLFIGGVPETEALGLSSGAFSATSPSSGTVSRSLRSEDYSPRSDFVCDGDFNGDHEVTVDEVLTSIYSLLNGCPVPSSTPTFPATPTATPTATSPPIRKTPTATATVGEGAVSF